LFRIKKHSSTVLILSGAVTAFFAASLWIFSTAGTWRNQQMERLLAGGNQTDLEMLYYVLEQGSPEEALLSGAHLHIHSLVAADLYAALKEETENVHDVLAEGIISAQTALGLEPADAYAWARLAYFLHELDGPSPQVLNALHMSVYTAPSDPDLIYWRLGMTVHNHTHWNEQDYAWILRQIRLAWSINPGKTSRIALENGFLALLKMVLAGDGPALNRLEEIVEAIASGRQSADR